MNKYELRDIVEAKFPFRLLYNLMKYNGIIAGGCLRDIVLNKKNKDVDVFFVDEESWNLFNHSMELYGKEIKFIESPMDKLNVKKFQVGEFSIDSIYYLHVQALEHITETFDFTINMLAYNPKTRMIEGSLSYSPEEIIKHIEERQLIVGDNLWYKATKKRAIRRYDKFRKLGFNIDEANLEKYKYYLNNVL